MGRVAGVPGFVRGRAAGKAAAQYGELAADLARSVRGEVRFDDGSRAAYSTDASNYRHLPIAVVCPADADDAVEAVRVCAAHEVPVLSRGGGTALAGQSCNEAVLLDWSKHANRVESVDAAARTAVVEPGVVLDDLNAVTRQHGGLIFGPRPATHTHCTIGGMIGNDSCGSTAQWSGPVSANVRRLEVLTYDGLRMWVGPTSDGDYSAIQRAAGRRAQIYQQLRDLRDRYAGDIATGFPDIPRRISGYDLTHLTAARGFNVARALVGTESTCVTVLRAELDLRPEPEYRVMVLLPFPDIAAAADASPSIIPYSPIQLEGLDDRLIRYEISQRRNLPAMRLLPEGGAWLMVELGGDSAAEVADRGRDLIATLRSPGARLLTDPHEQRQITKVREAALAATARTPGGPDTWPGWEDSAVAPDEVGPYLRELSELLAEFGYSDASLYGHFGQGCVHTSIPFDLTDADGVAAYRRFVERAGRLCVAHRGSLSGEHGDGQSRGELLSTMYGPRLVTAFGEFKAIFDPTEKMNPGRVVHPRPLDADLRLGAAYAPAEPRTYFQYPADGGSFSRAALRCAGVGECRRTDPRGDVMCPSYHVTREEEHSTRGRARLLFEMVRGETIADGWRSEAVHDALDLCLACKGCRSDCPVGVDMATYKAEFLAHHYAGRLRPRDHYSLGWLPAWARLAGLAPGLANHAAQLPLLRRAAGIDPNRTVPRFARNRIDRWLRRRRPSGQGRRGPVVLFLDTFTTAFAPGIIAAAVGVLEAAGFRAVVPDRAVCCGLTWISTGQLGMAKRVLRRTVRTLAGYTRAGVPVLGLEPSCTATLRSDLPALFGNDRDAYRLGKYTRTLAELLTERAPDFAPSLSTRPPAIVQKHCHHHAVLGFDADRKLMAAAGLDVRHLPGGCCGLAGNFGMTRAHRDVSLACAERELLPAIRAADPATLVMADGFSCRLQIRDSDTGRRGIHLAEVLNAAIRGTPLGPYPERTLAHG